MLPVGIPREVKSGEKRVGLTPAGVKRFSEEGVQVFMERLAGAASGYSDREYEEAGARVVTSARELYETSGLIQKVKEPQRLEWDLLHRNLILCSYLHLASPENRDLVEVLLNQAVTAIGFETVAKDSRTILLEPMSEIAGTLAAYYSGFIKQHVQVSGGKISYPPHFLENLEALASHYPKVPKNLTPVRTVIFGGGVVGRKAAEALLQMGGEVDLVEKKEARRASLGAKFAGFGGRFWVSAPEDDLKEKLKKADVWIGSVHIPGERAPHVLSLEDLRKLSTDTPKLIVDVAVDQGGNFPESCPTTYDNPLYLDSCSNFRFGVPNIPSLCGRGASEAIERATLPYLLWLAKDWRRALVDFAELRSGVQVFRGKLVNQAVARAHQLKWHPFMPTDFEL